MKKLILILVIMLSSCVSADKIRFSEPASVEFVTASKFTVRCMVENRSAHNVTLVSARIEFYSGTSSVATVILPDAVTIPECSVGQVGFTLRIKFSDPLTMLSMANLESLTVPGFTLKGEAVVKSGMGRKKIRFNNSSLNEILRTFDPEGKLTFSKEP